MTKEIRPNNYASRYLMGLGGLLTALVVLVFWYSHFYGEVCNYFEHCISKWDYLKKATPNEIGDTLAGYAGTLAFVWIVVTVCLQAIELREQRLEFTRMADAQAEQVELLAKQGGIFEEEQKQRAESRIEKIFEAKLRSIQIKIIEAQNDGLIRWMFMVDESFREKMADGNYKYIPRYRVNQSADVFFATLRDSLIQVRKPLIWSETPNFFNKSWNENEIENLLENFTQLVHLREKLAEDQSIRFDDLGLSAIKLELELILSDKTNLLGNGANRL